MTTVNTEQLSLIKATQTALATEEGQILMSHLKDYCYGMSLTFRPDPYLTAFNEGMRFVYTHLQEMLSRPLEDQLQTVQIHRNPFAEDES